MSVPDALKKAWLELPENSKHKFCKSMFARFPDRLKGWWKECRLPGELTTKLINSKSMVKPSAIVFDKVVDHHDESRVKSMIGFVKDIDEGVKWRIIEEIKNHPNTDRREVVRTYVDSIKFEFADLYCEFFNWNFVEPKTKPPTKKALEMITKYKTVSSICERIQIACSQALLLNGLETERINALFTELSTIYFKLESEINSAAKQLGLVIKPWEAPEEIELFILNIDDLEKEKQLFETTRLFRLIGNYLDQCSIWHNSQRKQEQLQKIKEETCTELMAIAADRCPDKFPFGECETAIEWFQRLYASTGELFDEIVEQIQPCFPNLAQLIENIDLYNLQYSDVPTGTEAPLVTDIASIGSLEKPFFEEIETVDVDETETATILYVDQISDDQPASIKLSVAEEFVPEETETAEPEGEIAQEGKTGEDGAETEMIEMAAVLVDQQALDESKDLQGSGVVFQAPEDRLIDHDNSNLKGPVNVLSPKTSGDKILSHEPSGDHQSSSSEILAGYAPQEEALSNHAALLASLINEKNLEWAYWLSVALGSKSPVPAWLIEIAELGIQFQPIFRHSEDRLRQLFIENAENIEKINDDAAVILGAALIRPMLMAPHTYPMFFMEETSNKLHRLPHFNELGRGLGDFAKKGIPLGDDLLQRLTSLSYWETERALLEHQTEEWLNSAPKRTVKHPKATIVWEKWVGLNGDLKKLIVESRSFSRKREELESDLEEWRSETLFERKLDAMNKEISRGPSPEPIRFGAKDTLRRYAEESLQLVERWITYHVKQPKGLNYGYGLKELRELAPIAAKVASSLPTFSEENQSLSSASTSLMRMVLLELSESFQNGVVTRDADPISEREGELLLLPTIAARDGELFGNMLFLEALLNHLGKPLGLEASFKKHLELGHIALATRVLSMLPESSQLTSREKLEEERKTWVKRVDKTIRELSEEIMGRLLKGSITETDQNGWEDHLSRLGRESKECLDEPYRVVAAVDRIRHDVDQSSQKQICVVREKMAMLTKGLSAQGYAISSDIADKFETIIANGDLSVANDILVRLELSPDAPDLGDILVGKADNDCLENYLAGVGGIFEHCDDLRKPLRELQVSSRCSISNEPLIETQRKNVMDSISWWNSLQASNGSQFNKNHHGDLFRLLRWYGFQIEASASLVQIEVHGSPNFWKHYRFYGAIESPIPLFGSQANRTHHLVLVWGVLDAASFAQWLKSAKTTAEDAITILYFNRLDALSRRKAIHSIRKVGFAPLVVDACLMAWLCRYSGPARTAELFGVCLPGGRTNPYTPEVAGSVPTEMFFGRQNDIDGLWRDDGPCLVYGGRQLGKSALLQQVKRRFHDPDNDRYVLYYGKFSTDLMDLIRRLLVNEGLLSDSRLGHEEKIKAAILKMLEDRPNCKIRILLDESDHLIEEDSKQRFRQLSLVRDLMTESNRRFKVVLAGLHSVQRFQRIPNQPLAHFGAPLCIGPLYPKDAENLVMQPLHALGFRFDPPSLVQRVLAYTNFHPSLIQLFCHDLVEAVQVSQRFPQEKTPPFVIDETTINQVFNKANLAKKMRDRFDWTLDLDKRYRVIGYTIAFLELMGDVPGDGLRVTEMLSQSRDFWPQGFVETGIDEMLGLLDEMVGLGLLIRTSVKGYRLRSHNVLRLLGSAQEIIDELKRFANEPFDHPADPQVVRRVLDVASGMTSPLTILQENLLLQRKTGVDLVVGSAAHNVDDVICSLSQLIKEKSASREKEPVFDVIDSAADIGKLVSALKALFTKGKSNQSFRVIITRGENSTINYINAIKEVVSWLPKLKLEVRYFRALFIIDPETLFEMHGQGIIDTLDGSDLVTIHRLKRWRLAGIGHWFHDVERISSKGDISDWLQESGGWPCILSGLQKSYLSSNNEDVQGQQEVVSLGTLLGLELFQPVFDVAKLLADFDGEPLHKNDIVDFFEGKISHEKTEVVLRSLLDLDAAIGSVDCLRLDKRLSRALSVGA